MWNIPFVRSKFSAFKWSGLYIVSSNGVRITAMFCFSWAEPFLCSVECGRNRNVETLTLITRSLLMQTFFQQVIEWNPLWRKINNYKTSLNTRKCFSQMGCQPNPSSIWLYSWSSKMLLKYSQKCNCGH